MRYEYLCPSCGGHKLRVVVSAWAKLVQYGADEYETEVDDSDHEWSLDSVAECRECGKRGVMDDFDPDGDKWKSLATTKESA